MKQSTKKKQQAKKRLRPICDELVKYRENDPETQIPYEELNQFLQKYDKITSSQIANLKLNDFEFQIRDIKFKVAYEEDDLFVTNKQLHQNFRRGLSYINFGNGWQLLRRGQKKFFDLYFEDFDNKGNQYVQTIHYYNIGRALEICEQNKPISIYVTEKANGENCQISYNKEIDYWSVSSKNKTIIIKNEQDLNAEVYTQNQYNIAVKVGREWMKILKDNQFRIAELKQILSDHTFIGEYCGHVALQHLVRYDQIQIRFFGIVKKQSTETCLSPKIAIQLFDNLGLLRVKFREEIVQGTDEFKKKIKDLEIEISKKAINEEGEGCVLYFCNQENNECLSLAKLKTIEYRIARKMREKLKHALSRYVSSQELIQKFTRECEKFPYFNDPQFQKGYYIDLFTKLINFGKQVYLQLQKDDQLRKKVTHNIRQKYLDLLDMTKQNKDFEYMLNYFKNIKQDENAENSEEDQQDNDDAD